MTAKTYKATNSREWSKEKTVATARRTTVAKILEKVESYPSVEVFKTGLSPYRYEPHHAAEDSRIEQYAEENDTPGVPVDRLELAQDLKDWDSNKCAVYFTDPDDPDEQYVQIRGAIRNYVVHYDTTEVKFEL